MEYYESIETKLIWDRIFALSHAIVTGNIQTVKTPSDIYRLIAYNGGAMRQKSIRKQCIYGEAKVSLMIKELYDAGYVKVTKNGRENIVMVA